MLINSQNSLAFALAFNNFVSAGISFIGTIVLTSEFGIENIGILGIIVSSTIIISPLIQFRLDLAFERVDRKYGAAIVALVQFWAFFIGVIVVCVGLIIICLYEGGYVTVVPFIGFNIIAANCSNIVWARKVCERHLGSVFFLQVVRASLGVALPLLLRYVFDDRISLMVGLCLSNVTFLFFLPSSRYYAPDSLVKSYKMVRERCGDLLLDNTIPVLINLASVYLAPLVVTVIFGASESGVIYLIFRLLLTPAQLLADPIRRSTYARFPRLEYLTLKGVRSIGQFSIAFFLMGCSGIAICFAFKGLFLSVLPAMYHFYYGVLVMSAFWAGMVIGNAPLTGLIPVLGISRLQSCVETIGFCARILSIGLGFIGYPFLNCLYMFIGSTILINVVWGVIIFFYCIRHAAVAADSSSV